MTEPTVLAGGQGETLALGPNKVRVLTDATHYGIAEGEFAPKAPGPPMHHHDWDEALYVLEGKLEVTVAGEAVIAWPGDYVMVPAAVPHTFATHGTDAARALGFFSSGHGLAYLRELAQAPGDADAIRDRHGVVVV